MGTWNKSPGLRIFFLVPRAWTDHYLPLHISVPAKLTRVMVGRIELVTPEQRAVLARIASIPSAVIQQEAERMREVLTAGAKCAGRPFPTVTETRRQCAASVNV